MPASLDLFLIFPFGLVFHYVWIGLTLFSNLRLAKVLKNPLFTIKKTLNLQGNLMDLSEPKVMGIINVTPDSFYTESRVQSEKALLSRADRMMEEGVDIFDVGGFSTRPGAEEITIIEELKRTIPAIEQLVKHAPTIPISVDTFRSPVALEAINHGAAMINDITAGEADPAMHRLVADHEVPYILMHMRGPVDQMMKNTHYDDVVLEVVDYLQKKISMLHELGAKDIIADPGLGFSKTLGQNYEIIRKFDYFNVLEVPLLVGASRKSMIYKFLESTPEKSLLGTNIIHFEALKKGARILRVHDVLEAKQTIKLYQQLEQ